MLPRVPGATVPCERRSFISTPLFESLPVVFVVGGVVEVAGFEQTEAQMQKSRSLPNMASDEQIRGFHNSPRN